MGLKIFFTVLFFLGGLSAGQATEYDLENQNKREGKIYPDLTNMNQYDDNIPTYNHLYNGEQNTVREDEANCSYKISDCWDEVRPQSCKYLCAASVAASVCAMMLYSTIALVVSPNAIHWSNYYNDVFCQGLQTGKYIDHNGKVWESVQVGIMRIQGEQDYKQTLILYNDTRRCRPYCYADMKSVYYTDYLLGWTSLPFFDPLRNYNPKCTINYGKNPQNQNKPSFDMKIQNKRQMNRQNATKIRGKKSKKGNFHR